MLQQLNEKLALVLYTCTRFLVNRKCKNYRKGHITQLITNKEIRSATL